MESHVTSVLPVIIINIGFKVLILLYYRYFSYSYYRKNKSQRSHTITETSESREFTIMKKMAGTHSDLLASLLVIFSAIFLVLVTHSGKMYIPHLFDYG